MQVFLIHGEYPAQQVLARLIQKRFGLDVWIPEYREETVLKTGKVLERFAPPEKAPAIDWAAILGEIEAQAARLRTRKTQLEGKAWVAQTELKERFDELHRAMDGILEEIQSRNS